MSLIEDALARQEARPVKRIDYDRMKRIGRSQKAALTRAVNSGDPEKVAAACKKAVAEWNEIGCWRDDWPRWQCALDDATGFRRSVDIGDL
jgi:hypothetical protein